ncbi:MAG: hypothetical protein R8K50_06265 [Mariprofundus sp.]
MKQTKKRRLFIALSVMVLFIAGWWIIQSNQPASPWKSTTVPYDSKCEGDCQKNIQELADIETAHLRGVKIVVRPDVNDAIAQLGDCLDSIMECVDVKDDPSKTVVCVEESICPIECKIAYASTFNEGMTPEQQLDGVKKIFLADGGVCTPRVSAP